MIEKHFVMASHGYMQHKGVLWVVRHVFWYYTSVIPCGCDLKYAGAFTHVDSLEERNSKIPSIVNLNS